MRLTNEQRQTILQIVHEIMGESARVSLFGSRADDNRIGGDVDLLVEVSKQVPLAREITLKARLEQYLGKPVDVITTTPEQRNKPFVQIARMTGVPL